MAKYSRFLRNWRRNSILVLETMKKRTPEVKKKGVGDKLHLFTSKLALLSSDLRQACGKILKLCYFNKAESLRMICIYYIQFYNFLKKNFKLSSGN